MNNLLRKINRLKCLSGFIKVWLFPTWLLLGASRLMILVLSFKTIVTRLGVNNGSVSWIPILDIKQEYKAMEISRLIQLSARYTPWVSNCFPQAVTARMILSFYRIPYALYFGITKDHKTGIMKAHAWVVAGRINVTGGSSFDRFTVVGCFTSDPVPTDFPPLP